MAVQPADSGEAVGRGSAALSFLGACLVATAVVFDTTAATLFAGAGLLVLSLALVPPHRLLGHLASERRLTAALVCVACVAVLVPTTVEALPRNSLGTLFSLFIVALAVAQLFGEWPRRHPIATGMIVMFLAVVAGAASIHSVKGVGLDVVQLHIQAAAALARGENPYGPAVSVLNGSPNADSGSTIVGYPYPPVAAATFAGSAWLWGDPRWASLLSWVVVLASGLVLLRVGARIRVSLLPFLLPAAFPGTSMILQAGWTEPLSAGLLGVAAATWEHPIASGMALGSAFSSKQYFVIALPLVLLYRDAGWKPRATATLLTGALMLMPAFVLDPSRAWRSLVLFHLHTEPRGDSANIAGVMVRSHLQWIPPAWLGVGISLTLISLMARRASGVSGFYRALAVGLGSFFMFASQAMPNYWYLVAVTAALGSHVETAYRPATRS